MYNKIMLVGRWTADPELKSTQSGKSVVNVNIAVDTVFKEQKETLFMAVVVWNSMAEAVARNTKKGHLVLVDGRLRRREYNDKEGNKRYAFEVVAEKVKFLAQPRGNGGESNVADYYEVPFSEDDLPF